MSENFSNWRSALKRVPHKEPDFFPLDIGNARFNGQRSGSGACLIFLHAGVADFRMWWPQFMALSDSYETVAYSRRGFGLTTSPDEAFSHVEDLRAVMDQLAVEAVHLVGCSQGGRIAIDFALAYPARVQSLTLVASAVSGAPAPEEMLPEIEVLLEALESAEEADDLDQINAIEAHLWLDGPTSSEGRVSDSFRDLFLHMNGIALQMPDFTQEIEPPSAYERVGELTQPTLVMWGNLDFPHIQERNHYLATTIPKARGVEIADTAHLPNVEKPEAFTQLLRDFLEGVN